MLTLEQKLRHGFSQRLFLTEVVLYIGVGILLSISAAVGILETTAFLWQGIITRTLTNYGFLMLNRLLLVLMLVEILHTVRISIHSKEFMLVKPFLIVGLIATIRRVLVITMQAAHPEQQLSGIDQATAFHNAMIELALLGFLILVFALSIYWLDRVHRIDTPEEP